MIGYCVQAQPELASYRLRVVIPRTHLGMPSTIGIGDPTFFYKAGSQQLARDLPCGVVYDVVNDHFTSRQGPDYYAMCSLADVVTCASEVMRETVHKHTGKWATVIDDPYENDERPAAMSGSDVLWFGHSANITSLTPYAKLVTTICSNLPGVTLWSRRTEARCIDRAAVVLMTGNNPGASSNRVAKAIRAGRFVVTPGGIPSWDAMRDYLWTGDVHKGIQWALNNREEACSKIQAGQEYVRKTFSPQLIGSQWAALFGSTLARGMSSTRAGSV